MDNNVKCECNQKELCIKMRNTALKVAVERLKTKIVKEIDQYGIRRELSAELKAIENLLMVYECMPCEKLLKRVQDLKEISKKLENESSYTIYGLELNVEMLISEMEVFLGAVDSNN